MTLTGTISEKRDAGRKLGFFIPHLHSMPPLGGLHPNIAITFGTSTKN